MPADTIVDAFPLSSMQQGMLFHCLEAAQPGVDIEQVLITLPEEVEPGAMRRAWEWAMQRHAVLRTAMGWEGLDHPQQEVHGEAALEFALHDWRRESATGRRRRREALLLADRRRGFQLAVPPLWRVALLQHAVDRSQLVFTFHHLLLDGRALVVLLNEVLEAWACFQAGGVPGLPPPAPFRPYVEWLQAQDWRDGERFWRRTLKGFILPTPLDLPKPAGGPGGGELHSRVSPKLTATLRALGRAHGLTLNTFVLGAWALMLSRYSGEEDVVFGAVRACRHSSVEGADSIVGLLINTVPLRVALPPQQPVLAWLEKLREGWVALRPYENTPLPDVQGWSDVARGSPLFESIVNFQDPSWDCALQAQGGPWANRLFSIRSQSNYPLALDAAGGESLLLRIHFDPARFETGAVRRMLGHLKTLLADFAARPREKLAGVRMLTPAERRQVLVEWNRTRAGYPRERCVHELFADQVAQAPNALAVSDVRRGLSYRELDVQSSDLARHLHALGVRADVCVGICVERSVEFVVSTLGVLKAGGAYVPLDVADPGERLVRLLKEAEVTVIVTRRSLAARLAPVGVKILCIDDPPGAGSGSPFPVAASERPAPADLAYVIYTSGSTGAPKGVEIRHRSLMNLVAWHQRTYAITPRDRATLLASPAFDASVWEVWPYLAAGASIHIPTDEVRVSPALLVPWLAAHGITLCFLPTPLAEAVLDEPWPEKAALRVILTGGDRLRRRPGWDFPCALVNHYGPTESTVVTTRAVVAPGADASPLPSIGAPIANTKVYVLDRHLRPVPVGVVGELFIGGHGLARGYRHRAVLTAEKFIRDPIGDDLGSRLYRAGDLVRWRDDGELEFLGRVDQQLKIRGHRIEPAEIEARLNCHPAISESLVLAREAGGESQLVAYVLVKPDAGQPPAAPELTALLRSTLPAYMVPPAFVPLTAWPRTGSGKVDRRALPEPGAANFNSHPPFVLAGGAVEEAVTEIWTEVLHRPIIGRQDDFFELGGHSLRAAQIVARINRTFGLTLPVRILFDQPTVAGLAAEIEKRGAKAAAVPGADLRRASRAAYRVPAAAGSA